MKGKLEFDLPEEREDFELAQLAGNLLGALHDVQNNVFRPARKHGFALGDIKALLTEIDDKTDGKGTELIAEMEKLFVDILDNHEVLDRI